MTLWLKSISNFKRSILIITAVVALAITFETFQQLYYIRRFELAEGVTFFDLLQTQAYRWFIWLLFSVVLIKSIQSGLLKNSTSYRFVKLVLMIVGLVILNILIIALIQFYVFDESRSLTLLFSEYFPFFLYQKAPIYTLGYIAISMILHLFFQNEKLQIKVQQLSDLKLSNAQLFEQLSREVDEKSKVLNIKIGNNRKIIPCEHIRWIEADDYCVKVHTIHDKTYTMRSSMKALNEKLNSNFLRVHRKAIVNMDLANELNIASTSNLILQNGTKIPISKRNLKTVRSYFN
ncbi:LytTR family DNA-binding domain-containing protein [Psychroserpens sp.]|uniref:LytR/AlgR family response regulator transcription factor n=1 Tax=Psychroserpens sp. TaxID=2020870 RepID=UPI001B2577B1|nr:LytTR family DNA-binding domain-containing protein [Psychroserpens sp.]MBO6608027.1 LytTR family transcriptional regulator [Psychroserpens sp.]MBO6655137.1 LytTR family transcriptional regulator [Psychroserpens sp.]MBO6683237.1 LytTR family transcriptional regulator [Psychroserpens sp.]MBO6751400.1 LytTR family transcriptional regulator [Psychroserpens sp.]MBO6916726.1 LytTR family transcriptional regulator [Psychroserpens sp.]